MMEPARPQKTIRFACRITKPTDTQSEYVNTYCFSTETLVTRMHLNVTFISTLPFLFFYNAGQKKFIN
jgi:hypothetical protein